MFYTRVQKLKTTGTVDFCKPIFGRALSPTSMRDALLRDAKADEAGLAFIRMPPRPIRAKG